MANDIDLGSISAKVKIKIPRNVVKNLNDITKSLKELRDEVEQGSVNIGVGGGVGGGGMGSGTSKHSKLPKLPLGYQHLNPSKHEYPQAQMDYDAETRRRDRENVRMRHSAHDVDAEKDIIRGRREKIKEAQTRFKERLKEIKIELREAKKAHNAKLKEEKKLAKEEQRKKEKEEKKREKDLKNKETSEDKWIRGVTRRLMTIIGITGIIAFIKSGLTGGQVVTDLKEAHVQIANATKDMLFSSRKDIFVDHMKNRTKDLHRIKRNIALGGEELHQFAGLKVAADLTTSWKNLADEFFISGALASTRIDEDNREFRRLIKDDTIAGIIGTMNSLASFGGYFGPGFGNDGNNYIGQTPPEMAATPIPVQVSTNVKQQIENVDWESIGLRMMRGVSQPDKTQTKNIDWNSINSGNTKTNSFFDKPYLSKGQTNGNVYIGGR